VKPRPPRSATYKGRPHISLDALTDVCYACASRYATSMRQLLHRALWEYSGKEMPWHSEYVEAVVADVVDFVDEESRPRDSREREEEDETSSG